MLFSVYDETLKMPHKHNLYLTGERMTWGYWRHGHGRSHTGFLFHKRMFQDCAQIRTDDRYRWYGFPCRGRIGFHYSSICEYCKFV